ncbi:hypothetical protein FOL47_000394 [Perkinsus chesapeaki]|uniref:CN hydrolase domain-containing protein n=1 Tax=Perkinsus chesapeaki TaxID=330153 RepID=A0A7J6MLT2_PERCH|nr:hypothetical protein FOL47_000394 [Perkinsus chesapeaki]
MIRCSIQGFPLLIGLCLGIVIAGLWSILVIIDKLVFAQPNTKSEPLRCSILWTAMWYGLSGPLGTFELLCTPLYVAPALLQPISIFGVFGLELMVMYTNASIASFVSSKNYKYITRAAFDLTVWVVVSILLFSVDHNVGREAITVATITPGALLPNACGGRSEIIHVGGRLPCNGSVERMLNLTEWAAGDGRAKIVVWPEAWLSGFSDQSSLHLYIDKQISPVVERLGIFLTLGATVYPQQNLAITINNEGQVISVYGKQYPFWVAGEKSSAKYGYPLFHLPSSMGSITSDVPVSGTIGKAGTLICYDMDFTATARELAALGASIILNPSNDWSAMRNHYGVSVLRAIENNIPIVKADGAWDSAIVDGKGKVTPSDAIEMDGDEYDSRADGVLDTLFDAVDQACEKDGSKISGVDLHDGGVLEVETDDGQTFVINKHDASKLLWYSSPISGPGYFAPEMKDGKKWWSEALNASIFDQFTKDLKDMGSTALPQFRQSD